MDGNGISLLCTDALVLAGEELHCIVKLSLVCTSWVHITHTHTAVGLKRGSEQLLHAIQNTFAYP
jgi:hypothetical protein